MPSITVKDITNIRVSSVLNKDVKNYGKKNLLDGSPDSCWNSDKGKPQWVSLDFNQPYKITGFKIEFQGGFVGQDCLLEMIVDGEIYTEPFYPEDVNGVQKFTISKPTTSQSMKFLFNNSTDFFGRVTIYSIDIINFTIKSLVKVPVLCEKIFHNSFT